MMTELSWRGTGQRDSCQLVSDLKSQFAAQTAADTVKQALRCLA